jgi:ABC-type nitrate/sulfonate/bicarbonate transport system permease component
LASNHNILTEGIHIWRIFILLTRNINKIQHLYHLMATDRTTFVVFAIAAALGILAVVAVDVILTAEEVEAQKPRGCNRSVAANASQGRCVNPGS